MFDAALNTGQDFSVPALAPGAEYSVTRNLGANSSFFTRTADAVADFYNIEYEQTESNNTRSISWQWGQ
jgi:hypothetical protein